MVKKAAVGVFWVNHKKQILFVVGGAVLLAVVVGSIFFVSQKNNNKGQYTTKTETQATKDSLERLEKSRPKADAPAKEQASYYDSLAVTRALAGDYPGAINAMKQLQQRASIYMTYDAYVRLSGYYDKAGDKENAVKSIDKAISLLPPNNTDPDNYFDRQVVTESLQETKKGYL